MREFFHQLDIFSPGKNRDILESSNNHKQKDDIPSLHLSARFTTEVNKIYQIPLYNSEDRGYKFSIKVK